MKSGIQGSTSVDVKTKKRRTLTISLIFISLVVFAGLGVVIKLLFFSNPNAVEWKADTSAFSQSDRQEIMSAVRPQLSSISNTYHQFDIVSADRQGAWADLGMFVYQQGSPVGTEPIFVIALKTNGNWSVWTPSSPQFCTYLRAC
jgi:hypothetical protein